MHLKFSELNLEPRLQSAIEKLGYQECTPVQSAVIPHVLEGKDVSGLAQTGTGKTAAFLIPLMDRILKQKFADWHPPHFILILVPTRELAEQVYENVQMLSEFSGLKGVAVYGGTGYEKQKEAFKNNVEFVVATPGRLIDLYKEHFVDLKQVRAIVFDEADRMFDMGFKDDMKYILQRVPKERQFLVFSATLNFDVLNTAYQFGADPIEVDVSRDQARAENVKDEIFHVGFEDRPLYLLSLLKKHNPRQTIVFSNFKLNVEKVASFLSSNGLPAMGISSLLTQAQRNRVLELFKAENEKNILVATDVAARGLDIKGVDMVINYELPNDAESYVHRIGRTGRAGEEGRAFSLVSDRDVDSLKRIEDYLKHKLQTAWLDDADLVKDFKLFPIYDSRPQRSFDRPPRHQGPGQRERHPSDRRPSGGSPRRDAQDRGPQNRDFRGSSQDRPSQGRSPQNRQARNERPARPERQGQLARPSGQERTTKYQGKPSTPRHGNRPHNNTYTRPPGHKLHFKKKQVPPKTVIQKVTGFIKKIFGD